MWLKIGIALLVASGLAGCKTLDSVSQKASVISQSVMQVDGVFNDVDATKQGVKSISDRVTPESNCPSAEQRAEAETSTNTDTTCASQN